MYNIMIKTNTTVLNTGNLQRVDFRCPHIQKNVNYIRCYVIIISLCIFTSNHHVVYTLNIHYLKKKKTMWRSSLVLMANNHQLEGLISHTEAFWHLQVSLVLHSKLPLILPLTIPTPSALKQAFTFFLPSNWSWVPLIQWCDQWLKITCKVSPT